MLFVPVFKGIKKFIKINRIIPFLLIIFLLFNISCSSKKNEITDYKNYKNGKYSSNLTLPVYEKITSFNPYNCFNSTEKFLSFLLYDSLVFYDSENEKFYNWLSDHIEKIGENEIKVYLKDGLKSSTGNIIGADYVLATYYLLKKISDDVQDIKLDYLKNYSFIKVSDNIIKIKKINTNENDISRISQILQLPILPISIVKKIRTNIDYFYKFGVLEEDEPDIFISEEFTGPWVLQKKEDNKIVLIKNIFYNFFDKKGRRLPYFEKIILKRNDDLNNEFKEYIKKSLDAIIITESDYNNLKKYLLGKKHKVLYDKSKFYILLFNYNSKDQMLGKLFQDKKFRIFFRKVADIDRIFDNNSSFTLPFDKNNYKKVITKNMKNINEDEIKEYIKKLNKIYTIYYFNKDQIANSLSNKIAGNLKKYNLQFNSKPIDLTTLVAKIYADNSWDFLILSFTESIESSSFYNFYNIDSKEHLLNLGNFHFKDDIELFQLVKKLYSIEFLYNTEEFINSVSNHIFNSLIFLPIGSEQYYIYINDEIENINPVYKNNFLTYDLFKFVYAYNKK